MNKADLQFVLISEIISQELNHTPQLLSEDIETIKDQILNFVKKSLSLGVNQWVPLLVDKLESVKIPAKTKHRLFVSILTLLMSTGQIDRGELKSITLPQIDFQTDLEGLTNKEKIIDLPKKEKSFNDFAKAIAFKESSGDWTKVNTLGYVGLYQFGKIAIKDILEKTDDKELKKVLSKLNVETFRKNPNIFPEDMQHKAFVQLLKNNKHYLRRYKKYIGEIVGGIEVTESGLLAAAHLGGNASIKAFLKSGGKDDRSDAYGTKVSEYLKNYGGYDIPI